MYLIFFWIYLRLPALWSDKATESEKSLVPPASA